MNTDDNTKRHGGVFTYGENTNYYHLNNNLTMFIEAVDKNVAYVYFTHHDNWVTKIPIPDDITMKDSRGRDVAKIENNFIISWGEPTYTLYRDITIIVQMTQKMQNVVRTYDASTKPIPDKNGNFGANQGICMS